MHLMVNMFQASGQMSTAPDNVLVDSTLSISVSGHQELQDCGQGWPVMAVRAQHLICVGVDAGFKIEIKGGAVLLNQLLRQPDSSTTFQATQWKLDNGLLCCPGSSMQGQTKD